MAGWPAIHPDDRENAEWEWRKAVAAGGNADIEFRLWHAAGNEYRRTNLRARPLINADGSIKKWIGINTAIDTFEQAKKDLQENEQLLAAVFNALPVGVGFYNNEGDFWMLNQEMLRYLPNKHMPAFDDDRYWRWRAWDNKGNLIERHNFPGNRALLGESVLPGMEMLYTSDDGKETWTRVAATPVKDAVGRVIAQLSVITNVNEQKQIEGELQKSEKHHRALSSELYAILESMGDAVYIGGMAGITLANNAALEQLGFNTREELNRHIGTLAAKINTRDAVTGEVIPADRQAFARALQGERVTQDVMVRHRLTGEELVIRCAAAPVIQDGKIIAAVAVNTDVTEQHKAEAALKESNEWQVFLLKLSDVLRPLNNSDEIKNTVTELLGSKFGVSRCHYGEFTDDELYCTIKGGYNNGVDRLEGTIPVEGFGPEVIRILKSGNNVVMRDVRETGWFNDTELAAFAAVNVVGNLVVPLIKGGRLMAVLAFQQNKPRIWTAGEIEVAMETAERTWAAVERARFEAALQESETKFKKVVEQAPVAMAIYTGPEFVIEVYNDKVLEFWGRTAEQVKNKPLFEALPEASNQGYEELLTEVLTTGKTHNAYELPVKLLRNGNLETAWINFIYEPVRDIYGAITGVMVVCNEVTALVNARVKIEEAEERGRLAIEAADLGTFDLDVETGRLITSARLDDMFGIKQPAGYKDFIEMVHPDDLDKGKQAIDEAFNTGKLNTEIRIIKDNTISWVQANGKVWFNREGRPVRLLGSMLDITLRKTADEQMKNFTTRLEQEVSEQTAQLKESRDRLQSFLDTTLVQMSILQAIRDESGGIADMEIKMVNKELERETGRKDLVGKRYTQEYPGVRQTKLFSMIVDTIETGNANQTEYYYPYEGFNNWYSCMFVKLNDGVVATNINISDRKQAEDERLKNYTLLQQSEELALLGNWDFDLLSGTFTWSDGMYRLFDLEKGTEIAPEIYLMYTTEAGRPAAEQVVRHIREGDTDFMETLEMTIAGQIKILNVKATVVRNDEGRQVRVLGVDIDITASREADEKIRQMAAEQQQEIFRVTLVSQEEERRRIAESLHNGLGQLLFGIKISMAHLTQPQAVKNNQAFTDAKKYTEGLLSEAIAESRRISHELMPPVLEEFGLKAAIEDVCRQLSKAVKFKCIITGLDRKLDKYLLLAVFRTVQELLLNVAKHSQASKATSEVSITAEEIVIKIQDNGCGFTDTGESKGIGLASIKSKVKLLNGNFEIISHIGEGTTVTVKMPV